ncbi:hypothetical protein [Microbacterium indicum]|uniref:hypothetical protein n=1 Tax=Microbacterium indicum TaxID=358100 RepID=UPI0003FC1952|nr:hypothetical protein [Microbacterium indicum]
MASRDDDALSWGGDDDPTLQVRSDEETVEPEGDLPPELQPDPDEDEAGDDEDADEEPSGPGNLALVGYGILGGVYALWTAGWVLGSTRLLAWIEQATSTSADVMFLASMILAIAAPIVWFVATLWLTRNRSAGARFLALAVGALLTIPWPFAMVGGI